MKTIKRIEKGCGFKESVSSLTCEEGCLCNDCSLLLKQTKEIVKMIEGLKKKEKVCMEKDEYDEQVLEHTNQIEMADKILAEIKGKKYGRKTNRTKRIN